MLCSILQISSTQFCRIIAFQLQPFSVPVSVTRRQLHQVPVFIGRLIHFTVTAKSRGDWYALDQRCKARQFRGKLEKAVPSPLGTIVGLLCPRRCR